MDTVNQLKSDLVNPGSTNFKIFYGILSVLIIVYLVRIYMKKRKAYLEKNPVFFQDGIDPKKKLRIPGTKFLKSDNGTEATFFFWTYVDNLVYKYGSWKDIFIKGRPGSHIAQCPAAWIHPKKNSMRFEISTDVKMDKIDVDDFPIRKWFSSAIVIRGTQVEIYRDAMLVKTQNLSGNMRENSGDLWIGNYGGYGGNLSCVQYFSKAIGQKLIKHKHSQGPFCYPWWQKIWKKIRGISIPVPAIKVDVSVDLDTPKWSSEKSGICSGRKLENLGKSNMKDAKIAALKKNADCISYVTSGQNKGNYMLYKNTTSGSRLINNKTTKSVLRPRKQDKLNKKAGKPPKRG